MGKVKRLLAFIADALEMMHEESPRCDWEQVTQRILVMFPIFQNDYADAQKWCQYALKEFLEQEEWDCEWTER